MWTGEHSKKQCFMTVEARYTTKGVGGRAAGQVTHLTLTLVQMIYSISSENGFWKVKELVLIQIHSLDLERNRYMTERTWPFSFTTCNENTSVVHMLLSFMLSSTLTGTGRSNKLSRWVMDRYRKTMAAALTMLKGTYIISITSLTLNSQIMIRLCATATFHQTDHSTVDISSAQRLCSVDTNTAHAA